MTAETEKRVELHLHTTLSGDISLITPKAAVQEAVRRGLKAIAITDRNSVQSFYEIAWYRENYGKDLKVIYGAELSHISGVTATVLVKDRKGLKPLYKLISGKTITPEQRQHLLFGANELSPLHQAVCDDVDPEALGLLAADYDYIELITSDDASSQKVNQRLYVLGKKLGKPVVAVGNCHYLNANQRIGKAVLDQARRRCISAEETHLRTTEEMLEQYAYLGEKAAYEVVVTNPNKIADSIDQIDPSRGDHPAFTLPDADVTVRQICEEKLRALYGTQPQVWERLEQELACIGENISMFLLCHKIVQHVKEKDTLTGIRGTAGSTLIAWLLDFSDVNPLPAHYCCPACQYTEFVQAESGFDLPSKACPHCGKPMVGGGHNISFEACLGLEGEGYYGIDLNMTDRMRNEAKRFLAELLGIDRLAAAGTVSTYSQKIAESYVQSYVDLTGDKVWGEWITDLITGVKRCDGTHPVGIMLLPEGMEWEDVTPLRPNDDEICKFTTHFEHYCLEECLPKLNIMSVNYYDRLQELFALTGTKPSDIDYRDPKVYALFQNLDTCGVPEFSSKFVQGLLALQNDICFSDLIKICGMAHGTNVWRDNGENLVQDHAFQELIGNRDDVFLTLRKYGIDRKTAYAAMTATRKGALSRYETLVNELAAAGIPGWYLDSMGKVKYLFPKAHAAHYCKIAYAIAWFKAYYPEAFYKVTMKYTYTVLYEACSIPELEAMLESLDPYDCSQSREWETVCFLLEANRQGYYNSGVCKNGE